MTPTEARSAIAWRNMYARIKHVRSLPANPNMPITAAQTRKLTERIIDEWYDACDAQLRHSRPTIVVRRS
jgi:hypothetical protein